LVAQKKSCALGKKGIFTQKYYIIGDIIISKNWGAEKLCIHVLICHGGLVAVDAIGTSGTFPLLLWVPPPAHGEKYMHPCLC